MSVRMCMRMYVLHCQTADGSHVSHVQVGGPFISSSLLFLYLFYFCIEAPSSPILTVVSCSTSALFQKQE